MRTLRRIIRIPLLLIHVIVGIVAILLGTAWDRLRGHRLHGGVARSMQKFWSWSICRLLGVRLAVEGQPMTPPPALLVSNHLSWLDILVITAYWPVSFLSKSEVRSWPGIGAAATALGTLYIERGARNASGQATQVMAERLQEGHRVVFFPEGTTSAGREMLPFRPRLYQAALDAQAPVQPIVLLYLDDSGDVSANAPFVDDEGLLSHVVRLAGERFTDCRIRVCDPVPVEDMRRSDLARHSRARMLEALGLDPEPPRREQRNGEAATAERASA